MCIYFGCHVCRLTWHEPSRRSVKGSWQWQCLSWKMLWLPWIQSRRLTSPISASWATHPAPSSLSWRFAIFSKAGHIAALTVAEGLNMNGLQNSIESTHPCALHQSMAIEYHRLIVYGHSHHVACGGSLSLCMAWLGFLVDWHAGGVCDFRCQACQGQG